ncbi:MAG TPA: xylulokinase [Baekduia sp.]|nr:xylulokinase [Baekduia sp.]
MEILIGLDVGTTGVRALAIEAATGSVVRQAVAAYDMLTPKPGWTEQDPDTWGQASMRVLAEIARGRDGHVVGLGLAGQMHGSVFLDAADRPIRPALLWNDQRTGRQCEEIVQRIGAAALVRATGNPALTGFQAPKILWLRDEEPEHYARVASVLLPKDYVRLLLTGDRATDASDASGTLLLDIARRAWSTEILEALEIPEQWLPTVYEGAQATGVLRDDVAAELGLPAGLPVAAGGGDNAAAALGAGVAARGQLSASIGTSGVLFAPTDRFMPDPSGRVHAFCHVLPGAFHLMAVTLSAGGSLRWWRSVCGDVSFDALAAEAATAPPGCEGLVFLPYLTGERTPHLDARARGAFVGLTVRHDRAAMTRAVMEGVVLALRDGLEIIRGLGVEIDDVRLVGGGARSDLWRRLQADIFGVPVRPTSADEGPAHGAALLAGVAAGIYASPAEALALVPARADLVEPDRAAAARYDELHAIYQPLYQALRGGMLSLGDFADASAAQVRARPGT